MASAGGEVAFHVAAHRDADYFETPAEPTYALDVIHRPFAFREVSTVDDDAGPTTLITLRG